MRKHKSVVAILLAVMMIFTFMPTMAFAAPLVPMREPVHDFDHENPDKELSTKATCTTYGVNVYKCEGEDLDSDGYVDIECPAVLRSVVAPTHGDQTRVRLTKDEYLRARMAQDGDLNANGIARFYKYHADNCYVYVNKCKDCGEYDFYDLENVDWQGHVAPKGTKDCQDYTCTVCKETVKATANHDWKKGAVAGTGVCGTGVDGSGYTTYTYTCSDCGETKVAVDPAEAAEVPSSVVAHTSIGTPFDFTGMTDAEKEAKKAYLVQYGDNWYAPNEFDKDYDAPTCDTDSAEGFGVLVCKKCGVEVGRCKVAKTGHDWKSYSSPATCTSKAFTADVCSVCGAKKDVTYSGEALGHDYKVEVAFGPSCEQEGVTLINCTRCGEGVSGPMITAHRATNMTVDSGKPGETRKMVINSKADGKGDWYFMGFNGEFYGDGSDLTQTTIGSKAIKLESWDRLEENLGAFEDFQEATCELPALQAKKCSTCGNFNVHTVEGVGSPLGHNYTTITQEPTCGAKGFIYKVCSVCDDFEFVEEVGKPVVGYGAKCKFDKWVVEKAATPFEEGTKKLVCSVCGDDGHLIYDGGEMKEVGVTRTAIAKTSVSKPGVKVYKGKKKATVTVKAATDAVSYKILVNGKVSKTVTTAGKVTVTKGLKVGKKNTFQIKAYDANNNVAKSGKVTKIIKKK